MNERCGECIERRQLNLIQRVGRVGYWEFDPACDDVVLPAVSRELLRALGLRPLDRDASPWSVLVEGEFRRLRSALEQASAQHQPFSIELRALNKEGETVFLLVRGEPTPGSGERSRLEGTFHDISDLKRAEIERERTITQLQALLDALPQGISVVDSNLRLMMWNRRFHEILDFPQKLVYRNARFEDFIRYNAQRGEYGPGDPEEHVTQIVARAREFKPHRFERTLAGGRVLLVEGLPFTFGGTVSGFITCYTDITENKRADELIARQRDVMKVIIDNFPGGVSFCDTDLRFTAYNEQFQQLLEFPPELFATGSVEFETLARFNVARGEYGPGDPEEQLNAVVERARNFQPHRIERQRPNGRWLEIRGTPVPSGGFVTSYIDITERKQAEHALRSNEERWKFALEGARDGVWDWNLQTGEILYSKRWKEIFGFTDDEPNEGLIDWSERVHPDDRHELRRAIKAHLSGETPTISVEYRALCKDGVWRWTHARGMVVGRDESGKPTRVVGTNTDISERKQIEEDLRDARTAAEMRREQVASLLDNADQGFLSFAADLVVEPECSRSCETMLSVWPAGMDAAGLLFGDDELKQALFRETITAALDEADEFIREAMLSLLPAEIRHGDRLLHAQYKILDKRRIMMVLTDITAERSMASMLDRERKRLELIVSAVTDSTNFFDAIESYRELLTSGLPGLFARDGESRAVANEVYRAIHTFKGLLNQFSFPASPVALHDVESQLADLLHEQGLTVRRVAEATPLEMLRARLAEDLAILSDALGDDFLSQGPRVALAREKAVVFGDLAARLLRGDPLDPSEPALHDTLVEISRLSKVSLKQALLDFDEIVRQTAARTGKRVGRLAVEGAADIWLEPDRYRPFLQSLGHVFRNAVVHGLEPPGERCDAGKPDAAQISCEYVLENEAIRLVITDDGRGLDLPALRRKAVEQGLYGDEAVDTVADDEIAQLVFKDQLSTHGEADELAGRGVGLAAVMGEIRRLGGDIDIRTTTGRGTAFVFTLPYGQWYDERFSDHDD